MEQPEWEWEWECVSGVLRDFCHVCQQIKQVVIFPVSWNANLQMLIIIHKHRAQASWTRGMEWDRTNGQQRKE